MILEKETYKKCCNIKQHKFCIDCGKELKHLTTKRCQLCFIKLTKQESCHCQDCGKQLKKRTQKRCWVCYKKLHPDNFCIDCGKKLNNRKNKRCQRCYGKSKIKESMKCIDCDAILAGRNRNHKRCWDCYNNNRKRKQSFCSECSKLLSVPKARRCKKCHMKYVANCLKNRKIPLSVKNKIRKTTLETWKNKIICKKRIEGTFKALQLKPNKPEKLLNQLLKLLFKKDYKYVGNGKVILVRFNPDFINVNGQKKIIELYGDYWHNKPDYKKRDKRRLKSYTKLGYRTLIVWEHELKDLDYTVGKLIAFHEGKK